MTLRDYKQCIERCVHFTFWEPFVDIMLSLDRVGPVFLGLYSMIVIGYAKRAGTRRCDREWNTTEGPIYIKHNFTASNFGKPFSISYCFTTEPTYFIEYIVADLNTGSGYYDYNMRKCMGGHLMLAEKRVEKQLWHPTIMCGAVTYSSPIILSYHEGFLEYHEESLSNHTRFEIEVRFSKIDTEYVERLGNYYDVKYRMNACSWKVPVNMCGSACQIMSPGFPGLIPPLANCDYKLKNKYKDRILVHVQHNGLRRKSCEGSSLEISDKQGVLTSLCEIGESWFISPASTLNLQLTTSGSHSPPWNTTGFLLAVSEWPVRNSEYRKTPGTLCSYQIHSDHMRRGNLSTPDYYGEDGHSCEYEFIAKGDLAIRLEIYNLGSLSRRPENEYLELIQGNEWELKLDSSTVRAFWEMELNSQRAVVRYKKRIRQLANLHPIEIHFTFFERSTNKLGLMRVVGSTCDYVIDTTTSLQGSITTPEYHMSPDVVCNYQFNTFPGETLKLMFENLNFLSMGDGEAHFDLIEDTSWKLQINSTSHGREWRTSSRSQTVLVHYTLKGKRLLMSKPVILKFAFEGTRETASPAKEITHRITELAEIFRSASNLTISSKELPSPDNGRLSPAIAESKDESNLGDYRSSDNSSIYSVCVLLLCLFGSLSNLICIL